MIPLRDSTHSEKFPIITILLIILNIYIYFNTTFLNPTGVEETFFVYGLVPANFISDTSLLTLISYTFLHASPLHLIGNMWILWLFGDNVEDKMGKVKFLLFYSICGVLAGVSHIIVNPYSYIPVIGASGAVAGIMGAYFLMFRNAKVLTFVPPFFLFNLPAWIYLGFWGLSQLWCGAQSIFNSGSCGQIAFWAHIGGFITGMILYRFFIVEKVNY
ncbi:MAG TPA: rhomboid family intramembrane serine protease [Syntrophomonadaceae bacterium]|nr:rhomboid family intramembrane serine protease [Syntrophomonadaceae bacterium]